MNDPHVVSLRYRVKTGERISYNSPPPIRVVGEAYDLDLADDVLTVTMHEHHPTAASAMERVRDHLRAWELSSALEWGPGFLTFELVNAEVIDRDPPPPGSIIVGVMGFASGAAAVMGHALCSVSSGRYPDPPSGFTATPLVERLWRRYQQYLEGKDLLTTMGFAVLSSIAKGRAAESRPRRPTRSTSRSSTPWGPSRPTWATS